MSTEELIRRCILKNHEAWDEFVRRYEGLVKRSVYYKLNRMNSKGLRSDVDDIIQEVFLMLWEGNNLTKLRDISKLKSWLVAVTINKTSSYCRKHRGKDWRVTRSFHEYITEDGFTLEYIIPSREMDPARVCEVKELRENIRNKMGNLREDERLALDLNIFGEEKYSTIAEIMDVPVNTVTSIIRRGKRKVKNSIREYSLV